MLSILRTNLQGLLKGYLFFNVNGKKYLTLYNAMLCSIAMINNGEEVNMKIFVIYQGWTELAVRMANAQEKADALIE